MKRWVFFTLICICLFFLVPVILVSLTGTGEGDKVFTLHSEEQEKGEENEAQQVSNSKKEQRSITVFRSATETVEEVDLEEYVAGVVASEMPAEFAMEALKAQALTARTYVAKLMASPTDIDLPKDALVTDTPMHQVYHNQEELKEKWGEDYEWKMDRIKEAVMATRGQVLTYKGEPITAAFFSTSNGYTEDAEDYWTNPVPYLQSVESPWDQTSPRYENVQRLPVSEVERRLGVSIGANEKGDIVSRTDGGRVAELRLGGKIFHGREVRENLGLDSSDFQIRREGQHMVFTTKGWGHGVGMSQYGADGMAKEGKNYEEILLHYYSGVDISTL